jgi:hypothetical protein
MSVFSFVSVPGIATGRNLILSMKQRHGEGSGMESFGSKTIDGGSIPMV